jgi:hypothetical protein
MISPVMAGLVPAIHVLHDRSKVFARRVTMNEDALNRSLRKFLKTVGVTSQREIEKAVRDALASGKIKGNESLPAKAVVTLGGTDLALTIDGEIELE